MLFWAVVLLLLCMYLLGVVTKTLFSKYAARLSEPALVVQQLCALMLMDEVGAVCSKQACCPCCAAMTTEEEFEYVPDAMFTNFRCFTDGCAALLDMMYYSESQGAEIEKVRELPSVVQQLLTMYYTVSLERWKL